jgi:hypothetical protein
MAAKPAKAATVEPETTSALATAPADELSALLGDMSFDVDGLGSVDNEDIRITSLLFNLKGMNSRGELRQLNEFFNTTTETAHRELTVAFVEFSKMNSFRVFNNAENKSETICSSMDRAVGTLRMVHPKNKSLQIGAERQCDKCPDAQWRKDEKGKNVRDCATVYNVIGALLDESLSPVDPFLIRFAKTSAPAFKSHLNKYHIGKHPVQKGKHVPLFVYAVKLTLQLDKSGNFAVPVLTKGDQLPRATIEYLANQAKHFREMGQEYARAAERNEVGHNEAIDTEGQSSGPAATASDFADS